MASSSGDQPTSFSTSDFKRVGYGPGRRVRNSRLISGEDHARSIVAGLPRAAQVGSRESDRSETAPDQEPSSKTGHLEKPDTPGQPTAALQDLVDSNQHFMVTISQPEQQTGIETDGATDLAAKVLANTQIHRILADPKIPIRVFTKSKDTGGINIPMNLFDHDGSYDIAKKLILKGEVSVSKSDEPGGRSGE